MRTTLNEIIDGAVESVGRLLPPENAPPHQIQQRSEQLTELLRRAVGDAAKKPDEGVFLPIVRKTLRTLRGFADELKSVRAIAAQFAAYVEQIGNLITG